MPLKTAKARLKLLTDITEAFKEAHKAGIRNPVEVLKKVMDLRVDYKANKNSKKK